MVGVERREGRLGARQVRGGERKVGVEGNQPGGEVLFSSSPGERKQSKARKREAAKKIANPSELCCLKTEASQETEGSICSLGRVGTPAGTEMLQESKEVDIACLRRWQDEGGNQSNDEVL